MGRIGRNVKNEIDENIEQTVETRANYNQTAETYAASGEDSPPLPEDRIVLVQVDGTGNFVAVGVLTVSQGAKAGEKILYSRDENGEVKAMISLLNDGTIKLHSPKGIETDAAEAVSLKTEKSFSLEAKEAANVKTDDAFNVDAKSAEIKSTDTVLTGGKVTCKGIVTPDGQGCFCGIPTCPFTGAPQTGSVAQGA